MAHVYEAMLDRIIGVVGLLAKPIHQGQCSAYLALSEACNFKHDGIDIASKRHIEQELKSVFSSLLEPLVGDRSDWLARVQMPVFVVVVVGVSWLLILCPTIILCLLLESIDVKLFLLFFARLLGLYG